MYVKPADGSHVFAHQDDVDCVLAHRPCRFYVYFGFGYVVYDSIDFAPPPFTDVFKVANRPPPPLHPPSFFSNI